MEKNRYLAILYSRAMSLGLFNTSTKLYKLLLARIVRRGAIEICLNGDLRLVINSLVIKLSQERLIG